MKRKFLAVAAAALALGSASASAATFTYFLSGTMDSAATPCLHNPVCDFTASPWPGTLTIETDSTADGTYFEADLPLLEFKSSAISFTRSGEPNALWDSAFVTLAGGLPVSIDVNYQTSAWEQLTISGMGVTYGLYDSRAGEGEAPYMLGTGTLTLAASAVPEPASAGLLLAGSLLLGLRFRGASARPAR